MEEVQARIVLGYYNGAGSYELPLLAVPPRATRTVNLREVIATAQPDKDGDVIPAGVTVGGYRVEKFGPRLGKALTTEALVYDRQTKNFLTLYNTCCFLFGTPTFSPISITGPAGTSGQVVITGTDSCAGGTVELTSSGTFFSRNTSLATVGLHTGTVSLVSPGSTLVDASIDYNTFESFIDPCAVASAADTTPVDVEPCGDERDQIRDEYITRLIPVPACGEFTQTKSSTHFSFAEMNGGDYSWAVITDRLLTRLEQTRTNLSNKPIDVISGYRNPVRNANINPPGSLLSRHQYGDAADSCARDYNGDGVVNSVDRDMLVTAAQAANVGFDEIDPKVTCVHLGSK